MSRVPRFISTTEINYHDGILLSAEKAPGMETAPVYEDVMKPKMGVDRVIRIPDMNADFHNQFERFVRTTNLLVSAIEGDADDNDFITQWRTADSVSKALSYFRAYSCDYEIKIQFTGSSNFIGMARVFLIYQPQPSLYNPVPSVFNVYGVVSSSTTPHIDIDISTTGEYTLYAPYAYPQDVMPRTAVPWKIGVVMISTMQMADGTSPPANLIFHVFVRGLNLKTAILHQSGEASPFSLTNAGNYLSRLVKDSRLKYQTPVSKALSLGAVLAGELGFSRPTDTIKESVFSRELADSAVCSGQADFSHVVGVNPHAYYDVGRVLPLQTPTDMDIYALARRWCQRGGSRLPDAGYVHLVPDQAFWNASHTEFSVLNWLSQYFEYWTGDIEVKIVIPCSPLVRWRLGVVVIPPFQTRPLSFPTNGYVTYIIEVAGTTEFNFNLPWMYEENWAPLRNRTSLSSTDGDVRLAVYALTSTTGPSETPLALTFLVHTRAGPNFSFGSLNFRQPNIVHESGAAQALQFGESVRSLKEIAARSSFLYDSQNVSGEIAYTVPIKPRSPATAAPLNPKFQGWNGLTWMGVPFMCERGSYRYTVNRPSLSLISEFVGYESINSTVKLMSGLYQICERNSIEVRFTDKNETTFRYPNAQTSDLLATKVFAVNGSTSTVLNNQIHVAAGDDYILAGFIGIPAMSLPPA